MVQDQVISMIPYEQLGLDLIGKASDEALQAVNFQTLFVVQPDSSIKSSPQSLGITVHNHNRPAITTYPLTLECRSISTGFHVIAHFDSFVTCPEQMARLLNQFEHTLIALCTTPGSSLLSELTLLTQEDVFEIAKWNRELAKPIDTCIHELISARARQQPHSIAVQASDGELSYERLDQLSSRIGSELMCRGVGVGATVPFVFEKSLWATVAVLAILKAGGVCVPIEPSHPDARKTSIVQKVRASLVLASTSVDMTWCNGVGILNLGWTEMSAFTKLNSTQPKILICPQDTAYMLFTSGSTSEPKGVIWNHRTVSTTLLCLGQYWNFRRGIRVLQYAAHVFDISAFEILGTLAFGGCVCIPSDRERAERLTNFISCKGVDWAALTPTVLRTMDPRGVGTLHTLVSIGEPIGRRIVDVWAGKLNLFNGYGPCEACIFTTLASVRLDARYPDSVGLPVGCAVWIAEREDVNRLVPIGFTGEIVVEGYNVGAGYFPPNLKTADAFIAAPRWAPRRSNSTSAWYRTGDIGRYNSDGSISLLGRNDDQVKVRGQRFRLSEVEKTMNKHDEIGHIVVTIPKAGASSGHLTAILSLSFLDIDGARTLEYLLPKDQAVGEEILERIMVHASAELPSHMVPSVWLLVQAMPKSSSGKLDRFQIKQWLSNFDPGTFSIARLSSDQSSQTSKQLQSADERVLQTIWSTVLNLPLQQIGRDSSFIKLGGDSISAMQVASKCRARNLPVSIGDVIQCGTLARLAQRVADARVSTPKTSWQSPFAVEEDKRNFQVLRAANDEVLHDNPAECSLSPIQALLMKTNGPASQNQFNQSCIFEITKKVSHSTLQKALAILSSCHAMLTARFNQDHHGEWTQFAGSDGMRSIPFTSHKVNDLVEAQNIVSLSAASLDIVSGPVFTVELIHIKTGRFKYGILFIAAHHLIVDLVSWRIILEDLVGLLEGTKVALSKPMLFIDWVQKQEIFGKKVLLPLQVPIPPQSDLDFWGMKGKKNLRRDIVAQTFTLCTHSSSALLTHKCHEAYGTTTLDLLLAATIGSFVKAFPDRGIPALYNESFGREPWDASIDPSRTVGWFTTLYPVIPNIDSTSHLPHVVRATKDNRHEHSKNAWRIFTASMLSQTPLQRDDFEILFNYSGNVKHADDRSSILRHLPPGIISTDDIAPAVDMFGFINISVRVVAEKLRFSIMYNKNMAHTDRLCLWVNDLETTLLALIVLLDSRVPQLTLADLPLLNIQYNDLDFLHERLQDTGLKSENIESIYPCSPVQEGILLAQIQQPDKYWTLGSFKITSLSESNDLSAEGLAKAWELLCESHSILRTVFVNDLLRDRAFHQVVLRKVIPSVSFHALSDTTDIGMQLRSLPLQQYNPGQPQHHPSICYVGDQFYFRMEGNHALHDAAGIQLMCEELAHAFETGMAARRGSTFAHYISWVEQQRKPALRWWKKHMLGTLPCYFPKLTNRKLNEKNQCAASSMGKVRAKYANEAEILAFCQSHGITISTLFQAAWAIVLHEYTGDRSVSFGYLASGRDAPVENIDKLLGPTINLLVCRLDIQPNDSVIEFLHRAQDTFAQCVTHQAFSLTELQHILSVRGKPLFNTAMSLQRIWAADLGGQGDTQIELVDFHDPSEYDIVLAVTYSSESVQTVIKFKESHLSPVFANALAEAISTVITQITRQPDAAPDSFHEVDIDTREKLVELNDKDEALEDVENDDETAKVWQAPVSDVECELHRIWCEALRVPPEAIGIFDTFKRVGGDSLTAIQIVARCRHKGLKASVQLIFQCNGIADLAGKIEKLDATREADAVDAPFELSPIQKTVIEGKSAPENHHAMSFLLKVHRHLQLEELQTALKLVIDRHQMMRARFLKPASKWMQVISADVNGSFTCLHHREKKLEDLEAIFHTTQKGINLQSGPIGAAILCDLDEGQHLFLTIHHLVVDPISCQIIIRDLSQALTDGFLPPQKSLSFRSWVARQAELAKGLRIEDCLPYQVPASDYDYWGMSGLSNRAGDAVIHEFNLSKEATHAVVEDSIGFLDTLIATSLCAFSHCFPDRAMLPAVFTDKHGREICEEGEDLLDTVGWFSSIFPIALQSHVKLNDVMEVVQHVKVLRRSLQRNGSDYFTSRWLSAEGREAFSQHFPVEIMCHYYGSTYRELESSDTLFTRVSRDAVPLHPASDDFEVLALLSVAAEVQDEQLRVFVGYSKDIGRQPQIQKWIAEIERLLHGVYYA